MKSLTRGKRHPRVYDAPANQWDLARQWITDEKTPHLADSRTSMRPNLVPGYHRSVVLETGRRIWMFETREARDAFILLAWGHDPKALRPIEVIGLIDSWRAARG